jgi:hypothetical protein
MNFGSAFNSCLSSSQPSSVMATAPSASTSEFERAAVKAVDNRPWRKNLTTPSFSRIAPRPAAGECPSARQSRRRAGRAHCGFCGGRDRPRGSCAGTIAPERQREQRCHQRAEQRRRQKIEGKSHARRPRSGGQFQVNIILVGHHFFDGEIFPDKGRAGPAEFFAERGIAGELQQSLRRRRCRRCGRESRFRFPGRLHPRRRNRRPRRACRRRAPAAARGTGLRGKLDRCARQSMTPT